MQLPRIPELDGIRGIAILLVLLRHYGWGQFYFVTGPISSGIAKLFQWGWSGVDLFFVLSGFLIGGILFDHRVSQNYFSAFYTRRACRTLPIYFVLCAVFFFLFFLDAAENIPNGGLLLNSPWPLWSYALLLQNIFMAHWNDFGAGWLSVTWSLAIEEQFYLFIPFLIRYVSKRYVPYVLIGLIMMAPLCRMALLFLYQGSYISGYVLLPCRLDALTLGVLGAYIMREEAIKSVIKKNIGALYLFFIVLGIGSMLLLVQSPEWRSARMMGLGFSVFAAFYLCLILIGLLSNHRGIKYILGHPVLKGLGIRSYGIYLYHMIILRLCNGLTSGEPLQLIVATISAFVVTLVLASLSWSFFEKPIIEFGHRTKYVVS